MAEGEQIISTTGTLDRVRELIDQAEAATRDPGKLGDAVWWLRRIRDALPTQAEGEQTSTTDWDVIRERLEEGRAKLGGFGEPVWSQALNSLDSLRSHMAEVEERLRVLEPERDKYRDGYRLCRDKLAEVEAERDAARAALARTEQLCTHPPVTCVALAALGETLGGDEPSV